MPPPGGVRTSLSGAIAWLTSLGRGTRGPKTNNAAEKPVDVRGCLDAGNRRYILARLWHAGFRRPWFVHGLPKLGGSAEFITGWQCLIRSIDFALHRRMFEEANAL
jgi:hypothetical protein